MIAANDDLNELVRVTVIDVCEGRVKLGFQANNAVAIHREEVWERVRAEKLDDQAKVDGPARPVVNRLPYCQLSIKLIKEIEVTNAIQEQRPMNRTSITIVIVVLLCAGGFAYSQGWLDWSRLGRETRRAIRPTSARIGDAENEW